MAENTKLVGKGLIQLGQGRIDQVLAEYEERRCVMGQWVHGMRYTEDKGEFRLCSQKYFNTICVFHSYEEMEDYVLRSKCFRTQFSIMLCNLKRGDVVDLMFEEAHGKARIRDNKPEGGAFIFEWLEEPTQTNDLPRVEQNHIGAVLCTDYGDVKDLHIVETKKILGRSVIK